MANTMLGKQHFFFLIFLIILIFNNSYKVRIKIGEKKNLEEQILF